MITVDRIGQELSSPFSEATWYLLTAKQPEEAASLLSEVLEAIGIDHLRIDAGLPRSLLQSHDSDTVIITQTTDWDPAAYASLEQLRAVIRDRWPTLLWITTPTRASTLTHQAPNFTSFLLPNIARFSEGNMNNAERQAHLNSLQTQYGLTNEAVVKLAIQGELPQDADHQSWLILLGRGDLVVDVS